MTRYTPENIQELAEGEIFVFGSNLAGIHSGGAAKVASERFGACFGKGEGLTGRCYAFPTLGKDFEKRTDDELKESAETLFRTARLMPKHTFLVTKVGCGIAGYPVERMAELFREHPDNVVIPEEFA